MAPLSAEQLAAMDALAGSLTPMQQAWVSGYLAAQAGAAMPAAPVAAAPASLTVLYGSQTGNAKHVATDLADQARERGIAVTLTNMADYKPNRLKDETHLAIVVSTYGEGEPPEGAIKLYDFLASKKAPKLDGVEIAVLGLGDTSYEQFCQTAIDFEARLVALGAKVSVEKALLDVDFSDHTPGWINTALNALEPSIAKERTGALGAPGEPFQVVPSAPAQTYTRKNPLLAEVTAVQKITGRDSTKDVRHVEISLEGSGIAYKPGDALGLCFRNDPVAVDALLKAVALDDATLRDALIESYELTQSYPGFVTAFGQATGNAELIKLAEDKAALRAYLDGRQIFDIVREHPAQISAEALRACLRKMQPRLYSIASSQADVEDDVHLTVGVVEYEAHGAQHMGGASGFLAHRIEEGETLGVFVEENDGFRLPNDPRAPIIMIGPGTGIAPFRAFLQEMDATGDTRDSWLFFGNPHFTQDFLYQLELQGFLKSGTLSKLSVAFSRDQEAKIYVQDRIREAASELYDWIERGAHIYVCGDANRMARDVHRALIDIVAEQKGTSDAEAEAYLADLRDNRRYQRDVY